MKVLLCVDGSGGSVAAARRVASLQSELRSLEVTLLYVDIPVAGRISTLLEPDAVERMHRTNAQAALEAAREPLREARVATRERIDVGHVAERIASIAARGKFDLIAIGSRGASPFADWLLGSTTAEVLARTKVPVLVVKPAIAARRRAKR